jgi:hypothetical protein
LNDGGDDPFDELPTELLRRKRDDQLDDELYEAERICWIGLAARGFTCTPKTSGCCMRARLSAAK